MRRFLFSKWFFGFLALVCSLDLIADVSEEMWGWHGLNHVAILLDVIAVFLTIAMFVDLHRKRPDDGGDSRR
jgi:hypothetical protein